MTCDLSGVAGGDPLHVNKPAAAVAAHSPTTTGMCGWPQTHKTHFLPIPTYCPPTDFDFVILNIMILNSKDEPILAAAMSISPSALCCFPKFMMIFLNDDNI